MIHADPALFAPETTAATAPAAARARIEGQMAMLSRLAQMGMDIAEAVRRDACADPAPQAAEQRRDHGLVFARVARAVRMTIALQSRLAKDLAALDRADESAERTRKSRRRMRLYDLVEQAARDGVEARRQAGEGFWADEDAIEDEIEQLSEDAYERLTDAEDGELDGATFDEVVAAVAKDLGLSPHWTARVAAAVARPPDNYPHAERDPPPPPSAWTVAAAEPRAPP